MIKKTGNKTRETIFPETYCKCEQKMFGKKSSEKSAKNVFYIDTNIVTKKWGGAKLGKQFFKKHTNSGIKKCLEKNLRKIVRKKIFLYSYEYHDKKMGGIKRAKNFFQKHKSSGSKKCLEKNLRKIVRKTFFLY